jgi:hypothetical protein
MHLFMRRFYMRLARLLPPGNVRLMFTWQFVVMYLLLLCIGIAASTRLPPWTTHSSRDNGQNGDDQSTPVPFRTDLSSAGAPYALIQVNGLHARGGNERDVDDLLKPLSAVDMEALGNIIHGARLLSLPDTALPATFRETVSRRINDIINGTNALSGDGARGYSVFVTTRHGLRVRTLSSLYPEKHPNYQTHNDQLLATFAELGLPLSRTIALPNNGEGAISDLLADSMASFSLSRKELEWTALSYALYSRGWESWRNKFGETFTFDDLTRALLNRPLEGLSCAGTHLLYALCTMRQIDEQRHFLTDEIRTRLRARIDDELRVLQRTQLADGSWGLRWYDEDAERTSEVTSNTDALVPKMLVTSHHLEWITLLPSEEGLPAGSVSRAVRFLDGAVRTVDQSTLVTNFCPYVHSLKAIFLSRADSF